jgi:uncharacterized protein RhaS with RHS repeats
LLGHRYYDAGTGRFLNRDPIGYDGGVNLYSYVANNFGNEFDPEGLFHIVITLPGNDPLDRTGTGQIIADKGDIIPNPDYG